jgi:helicase
MNKIIQLKEAEQLVLVKDFPFAKYNFTNFNIVQSTILPYCSEDMNGVVAASTSSGKTIVAEIFGSQLIREKKKKFIYLTPLKALAQEKIDDWTNENHHFSDLKLSICTGDYQIDDSRLKEIQDSDIVILTSEMLDHRLRMHKSEKSSFIKDCGVLVVDESHLLTIEGRGDKLETALMRFTLINPEAKIILLSATMPNVIQLAEWISSLNKKDTFILESNYRPCKLNVNFCAFDDEVGNQSLSLVSMFENALDLVTKYNLDKFIIFTHSKKMGYSMLQMLQDNSIFADFHNADLSKEKRVELEKSFRNQDGIRVLVATSTLAAGVNTPARRVIILGTTRNGHLIPSYEIQQECGRAGRPAFDKDGDAYIFVGKSEFKKEKERLEKKELITSRLLDQENGFYKNLAFQILSEIHNQKKYTLKDIFNWYKRSFSCFIGKNISTSIFSNTLTSLIDLGVISLQNDILSLTNIGKVSVNNYVSPFIVVSFKNSFVNYFKNHLENDFYLSFALANNSDNLINYMTKNEKSYVSSYIDNLKKTLDVKNIPDSILKTGYCYYSMLNNSKEVIFPALSKKLKYSLDRTLQILKQIDFSYTFKNYKNTFDSISVRIKKNIPIDLVELAKIPKIGYLRAKLLYDAGFRNENDIINDIERASKIAKYNFKKL